MSKAFFDVFPTLKLDTGLHDLFEGVAVEKVTSTKRKDFLRVYIAADHLISKEDVFRVEREIGRQFFPNMPIVVKFYEHFTLSAQYDPKKLMDAYGESILLELKEASPVEYNMFKRADILFVGDRMQLTLEDTVFGREKAQELSRILEKIYNERCQIPIQVEISYKEKKAGKGHEEDEHRLALEVAQISARAGFPVQMKGAALSAGRAENMADREQAAEVNTPEHPAQQPAAKGPAATPAFAPKKPAGGKEKSDFKRPLKRSDNPDVIYGRDFEEEAMPIEEIIGEMGEVVIRGKVIRSDKREIKNERMILIYDITDYTDTMTVKFFVRNDQAGEITGAMKDGAFVKIKGMTMVDKFDHELTIGSLAGIKKIPDFTVSREDRSVRKRVELHCHTKMSDMDGVSEAKDLVKRAYKWGHPAIAITDHGVVQSFPDANHVWEDLWKAEKNRCKEAGEPVPDKQNFFKVIYGVEAYLVDDLHQIATNGKGQDFKADFVVFDIETTGFSPTRNRIIEIGAVK
ncbi:MAG: PHP domain-containing protein, partial [Lachnospiraceae bacterium]|nr:PHP domain-containing protein [Lachnospiraceae bacterium]